MKRAVLLADLAALAFVVGLSLHTAPERGTPNPVPVYTLESHSQACWYEGDERICGNPALRPPTSNTD